VSDLELPWKSAFSVSYCYTSNMPRYSWTLQNSPKPSHRRTPCDYISAVLRMIGTNNMFLLCYLFRPDSVLRGPNCWSIKPNSPDFRCTSSCLASGGLKNPSNGSERSRVALFARLLSSLLCQHTLDVGHFQEDP
jgi:hypothetical protein